MTQKIDQDAMYSPEDVAEFLGVSKQTLQRWRMTGEGPQYAKLSAYRIAYRGKDVMAWIETRLRKSTSEVL